MSDPYIGPKAYWTTLNSFLGRVKIPTIPPLIINNTFESNYLKKANIFNEFFSSQCTLINNNSELPHLVFKTESRITNLNMNSETIIKIIDSLNPTKAHGWDGISIKMIKLCKYSITKPLLIIFDKALLTGVFPENWKRANVVPVHKKLSKNIVNNYRPISLLPICSKVFEKIIYNSLFTYFKTNNILVKEQSGFTQLVILVSLNY